MQTKIVTTDSNIAFHALIASAILHATIYFILPSTTKTQSPASLVSFEFLPTNSKTSTLQQKKRLRLSDLVPKFPLVTSSNNTQSKPLHKNSEASEKLSQSRFSTEEDNASSWGSGGSELTGLQNHRATSLASEKLSGLLAYPKELARNQIGGTVNVRIYFTEDGLCDFKKIRLSSTNSKFNEHVMGIAQKYCYSNPLHGTQLSDKKFLDFSIQFDPFKEHQDEPLIGSNIVLLTVPGRQMFGTIHLGPIQTNPLLLPVIGPMIFADPVWIEEFFKNLKKSAAANQ